ncbi:DDE superfamily endonuclease [Streptomyces sp. Ag109_O5-1]|nr:DDE superfamily endonuclease [Streptomyces sp. Ag109_O5-1]
MSALLPALPGVSRVGLRSATTRLLRQPGEEVLHLLRFTAPHGAHSGKHKKHGMNVQVIADPFGRLLWASTALPGAVHDIRAARTHGIIDALAQADIPCWADKAYQGAGGTVRVPYRGRREKLSAGQQAVNRSHAKIRALGEQTMATLKTWRLLRKLRCSTTRITALVQAVLTLHLNASS